MSDTPRTDAFTADDTQFNGGVGARERASFALMRTLERENAALREAGRYLHALVTDWVTTDQFVMDDYLRVTKLLGLPPPFPETLQTGSSS